MTGQTEEDVKTREGDQQASPVDVGRLLEDLSSPVAGLLAGGGALLTGVTLLLDDAHDFGKLGVERDPPSPHHWLYGAILILGGAAGMGFNILRLLQANPLPPEARLPRSLVEGLPPKLVDRYR